MLKPQIESLDGLAPALREHYTKSDDGTFVIALDGEHPDTVKAKEKIKEMRTTNTDVMRDRDDVKAKFEELVKAKPTERITELESALAAEKTARAEAQKRADTFLIESAISDAFLKIGGRPEARAFIVAQSAGQFIVEDGKLKSTRFSPDRPGEPMSLAEMLTLQTRENAFAFLPSGGGGSVGSQSGGATGVKELRDPSPQDLGRYASEIAAGRMKIVYSS